jgi:hypothetical protein
LLTETFIRSFTTRMASQSPRDLDSLGSPNNRSILDLGDFPAAGSNRSAQVTGQRLYFLKTRTPEIVALEQRFEDFYFQGTAHDNTDRRQTAQRRRLFPLFP